MKPGSIFLVEDSPDFAFAIRRVWKQVDPEVELVHFEDTVSAMADLLERAKRDELPKLVLLDLNLPGRDGRDLLADLRDEPRLHHLPVVVLTTSRREEDVRFAYRHGARAFHVKPDQVDKLRESVELIHRYWLLTAELP